MENFGLITIENKRFTISDQSTSDEKFYIATLIAHEVAHHWFGDIVTMGKWSEVWLNEAFAEYLQYHSVQNMFSEIESMFYINEFVLAFEADSSRFTHALSGSDKFDDITYNKGAVVLSMISRYMDGSRLVKDCSRFCCALRLYLKRFAFGNAMTDDLLKILGNEVSKYINSWLFKPGFPVIDVSSRITGNRRIVTLRQRRFSYSNIMESSAWNISTDVKIYETLHNGSIKSVKFINVVLDQDKFEFSIPSQYQFFINSQTYGLYYTNYGNHLGELIHTIKENTNFFDDIERAHFIYQAFQLALSLRLPWMDAINTLEILKNEESSIVWRTILKLWFKLKGILNHHWTLKIFQNSIRKQIPRLTQPWPDPSLMFLGVLADSIDYQNASKVIFSSWNTSSPNIINPDYLDAIYFAAMKDENNFQQVWNSKSKYPGDNLKALIFSQYEHHQKRVLSYIQQNLSVSDCNLYLGYFALYSPNIYKLLWENAKQDYPTKIAKISGPVIETIVSNFAQSPSNLKEIQDLISDKTGSWDIPESDEPGYYMFIRRGIEKAIAGITFRSKELIDDGVKQVVLISQIKM